MVVVALSAAPGLAVPVNLTSGPSGTFNAGQSFNETRGVDITVLPGADLTLSSMRLDGLSIGSTTTALVGARVYLSSTPNLLASADTTVFSSGPVTIPISVDLQSGNSYRVAFYVQTSPLSQGSAILFDPDPPSVGGTPYNESLGLLTINSAHAIASDSFPSNPSFGVPQITLNVNEIEPPSADPSNINKSRFISFVVPGSAPLLGKEGAGGGHPPFGLPRWSPSSPLTKGGGVAVGGAQTALRVWLVSLHHVVPPYTGGPSVPFTEFEGQARWVGPPTQYVESSAGGTAFYASHLQCTPHYQDWSTVGLLHVTGSAIVPSSVYEVEHVAASCMGVEESCAAASEPLSIVTTRWGDVETPYNPPAPSSQPDLGDVSALVNKFRGALGAPIKARALLVGGDAIGTIDIATEFSFIHIASCVDAFRGRPYPHTIAQCTCTPGAPGCGWEEGDMHTYPQSAWGDLPDTNPAAALLALWWDQVYASTFGVLEVGIAGPSGFSLLLGDPTSALAYLPALGPDGALTSDLVNPTSSSAGSFGGNVVALRLNTDFSAAGFLSGVAPLADLNLCGVPGFPNMSLTSFIGIANTALGGGATAFNIGDLDLIVESINAAFIGGSPSAFAQDHLFNGACP